MQFRSFLTEQIAAIDRLLQSGDLVTTVRAAYTAIRDQFKAALQALPASDAAGADGAAVSSVLVGFGVSLQSLNAAVLSMNEALNTQWQARITSGDLVPKERHAQLCSESAEAARSAGLTQGKKDAETEFNAKLATEKRVGERASVIARNGLPPAPDEVLRLSDEDFAARQKDAVTRLAETKEAGIDPALKFVGRYAWAPTAEAEALADVVKSTRKNPGNPLAGGSGADAGGSGAGDKPVMSFAL